jgi:hypothetical protein
MKVYTIENDTNNIAVHASAKEAQAVPDAGRFTSEATLAKLAEGWPTSRLVSIWNTLPGVVPVARFASRRLALTRIWDSVAMLGVETGTPAAAVSAPEQVVPEASRKSRKAARAVSRTDAILALLRRPEGAGLHEILEATGWQAHSVRGFISGTVRKKMKLNVISERDENGLRQYRIGA